MKNKQKFLFGFSSPYEFLVSVFGLKSTVFNMIGAFLAILTTFITSYIWDSAHAVYTLLSLIIFDWCTGVFLALRATYMLKYKRHKLSEKQITDFSCRQFSSTKFPRIFVALVVAFWLLSISWNLSKANSMFYFLPGLVYGGFSGTYVISVWENLTEMGYFSKDVLALIKEKLDITKYLKK